MQGKFLNYGQLHIASHDVIEAAPSTVQALDRTAHSVLLARSQLGHERSLHPHVANTY